MKKTKWIAAALALVLALSLCATAFAWTGTVAYEKGTDGQPNTKVAVYDSTWTFDWNKARTTKDGDGYIGYYEVYKTVTEAIEPSYKFVKAGAEDVYFPTATFDWDTNAAPLIVKGYACVFEKDDQGKDTTTGKVFTSMDVTYYFYLIPCGKSDADYALYKNGSFDTWVFETGDVKDAYYEAIATVQGATTAKPNCTTSQFFEDGYVVDGDFYVDGGDHPLNVDGKIVLAKLVSNDPDYVVWASHIFAKGVKNTKTGELTTIEADEDDGLFGLFGFIGLLPKSDLFEGVIDMDKGYIKTDDNMHTNVEGVYAAGDIRVKSLRQVVTAAADGAIAAMQAEKYIANLE